MASILDLAKKLYQKDWSSKPGNQSIQSGVNRVTNAVKTNPLEFTPLSMRSKVIPYTRTLSNAFKAPAIENLGYGLRGALNLTPFQSPSNIPGIRSALPSSINRQSQMLKAQETKYAPTTSAQKTSERVGRALYGTTLTAPLTGFNPFKMAGNAIAGTGIGAGIGLVSPLLQGRLPNRQDVKEGALGGLENSWTLAFTNAVTDKLLAKFAPQLVGEAITAPFKSGQVRQGMGRVFSRALAEVLPETTAFTFVDQLSDKDKRDFAQAWLSNLPGNILSNLVFASGQSGFNILKNKASRDAVKNAIEEAARPWLTPVYGKYVNGKREVLPMWQYKLKYPDAGMSIKDVNEGKPAQSTLGDIKTYYRGSTTEQLGGSGGRGTFLTSDKGYAETFAGKSGKVREYQVDTSKLNIQKSVAPMNEQVAKERWEFTDELVERPQDFKSEIEALKKKGIDAVESYDGRQLLVFDPKNVAQAPKSDISATKIQEANQHPLLTAYDHAVNKGDFDTARKVIKEIEQSGDAKLQEYLPSLKNLLPKEGQAGFIKLGEENPFKLTEAGVVKKGETEVPNIGVGKDNGVRQFGEEEVNANLTTAVMREDEPGLLKKIISKWVGSKETAKTTGAVAAQKFTDIPTKKGMEFLDVVEGTGKSKDKLINTKAKEWKQTTDALYKEVQKLAEETGQDVGYLENYATHMWQESPTQINQIIQTAGKKFPYANAREIPSYKAGIELGLTPKYQNPAQILSEYVRRLEVTKANLELLKELKNQGFLVSAAEAQGVPGFDPIYAVGFPKTTGQYKGRVVEGNYYAPSGVARVINQLFSSRDKGLLNIPATVAREGQNLLLSGGVPKTPINAFTAGQVIKEVTSGRIKGPFKALVNSLSPEKITKYQLENAGVIKEIQQADYPITTRLTTESLMGDDNSSIGKVWNNLISDPTFKGFMPNLEIEFYKDVKNQAIKSGLGEAEAKDIAIKALRNFSGRGTKSGYLMQDPTVSNLKSTFFFAPTYRDAMIKFWANNIKALKNPLALENRANLKFLAGTAITIAAFDALNRKLNGHGLLDNPQGKEDKLLIPYGKTTIGIPILPSIGTIPRAAFRQAKATLQGDVSTALKDAIRSYGSFLAKPIGELTMNEDYFGNQIYDPNADAGTKAKQYGDYALKNTLLIHPWLSATYEKLLGSKKDEPIAQTITKAMELPIRYYRTESIQNAPFWEKYNEAKTKDEQLQELRYKDPNKAVKFYQDNKSLIDGLKVMREQVSAYYENGKNSNFLKEGGAIVNDQHAAFVGTDGKFHLIDMDFTMPELELTGNELLDKKIKSSYSSQITAKQKNVLTLFENQVINADQAEQLLAQLEEYRKKSGGSGKAKKFRGSVTYKATPLKLKSGGLKAPTFKTPSLPKMTFKSGYKPITYQDTTQTFKAPKPITMRWS